MSMNKEFSGEEMNPFQTIDRFVRENYPEGSAVFSQYGDSSWTSLK